MVNDISSKAIIELNPPHLANNSNALLCARLIPQEPLPNLGSFGWKVTTLCYGACYKSIV